MSFIETWDSTKPAGSRDRSLGDDDIREFKRAIIERLAVDHIFVDDETGYTTIGYHAKCTLYKQASNPGAVAACGILFTKDVGAGVIELFFEDAAGNVQQLTSAGLFLVLGSDAWRTGDKLLSSNTNTPTGWSDISSTYNNNFIRISSGTPLTTGGADTHTHTGTSGSTVLDTTQIPAHTHQTTSGQAGGGSHTGSQAWTSGIATYGNDSGSTGGGLGHTHTISSDSNVPVYVQMKMYSKT